MAQDPTTIITEIDAHMKASGLPNNRWNVGITSDVENRLFGDHRVHKQNDCWIYRTALTSAQARAIEAAYHKAGCKGSGGGGNETAKIVYAYAITATTVE
jgi:hypothetical protein